MKKILVLLLSVLVLLCFGVANVCADTTYHDTYVEGDQASLTDSTGIRYYASLSKALDDAEKIENCTVKLLTNIISNGSTSQSNKSEFCIDGGTFTFDGDGKTITIETTGTNSKGNYAIECRGNVAFKNLVIRKGICSNDNILKGGVNVTNSNTTINVTFDNCDINVIDNANKWGLSAIIVGTNANVTVNSGTYYGGKADGSDWQGINIGKNNAFTFISGTTNGIKADDEAAKFSIKGGTHNNIGFIANSGNTTKGITGGTFANNPSTYVDDDYEVIDNGNSTWTVVEKKVVKIGTTTYPSIEKALATIPTNNNDVVTIELLKNIVLNNEININKNKVVLDGKGQYSITANPEYEGFAKYKVGGSDQKYGSLNLIKVSGKEVTMQNLTVDIKDYRGMSCITTVGGEDVTYKNITYKGRGSGHYYGYGTGTIVFDNCNIETTGYGVHFSAEGSTYQLEIKDSKVHGWNSFGGASELNISDTEFYGANDEGKNGLLAKFRPYTDAELINCKFSIDYLSEDTKYCGFDTGAEAYVTFYNCSIINNNGTANTEHDIYEIIDYRDDDCNKESLFIFCPDDSFDDEYEKLVVVTRKNDISVAGFKTIKLPTVKETYDEKNNVYTFEIRKATDDNKIVINTNNDVPKYYEEITELQYAINNVAIANQNKFNKNEEVTVSTITVDGSGINAVIDDTIKIVANEGSNNVTANPGYKMNSPQTSGGKITYTATALEIGKDSSGNNGSGIIASIKKETKVADASQGITQTVQEVAGSVNDTEANIQLGTIVSDNLNTILSNRGINQGTAARALNDAGIPENDKIVVITNTQTDDTADKHYVEGKQISVFVRTYYDTKVIEDKTQEANKRFSLEITPMYQAYVSTATTIEEMIAEGDNSSNPINAAKIGESIPVDCTGKSINLKIELPSGFITNVNQKVYVIHTLDNGTKKTYDTIVKPDDGKFFIEFTNPDNFSAFEITLERPTPTPDPTPGYKVPNTGVEDSISLSLSKISSLSLLAIGMCIVIKKKKDSEK